MFRGREKSLALLRFKPLIVQIIDYTTSVKKKKRNKGWGGGAGKESKPKHTLWGAH